MSIRAGVGLSTESDAYLAAKEAVRQALTNLHCKKINLDLALAFSSIELAFPTLLKTIGTYLGDVPIIGCSGAAIISDQGISKPGLVILLLDFSEDIYSNTACVREIKVRTSESAGEELADMLLYGFHDLRRDLSIIFCDGLIRESSNLISGLQKKLGKSFPLVGGFASDNLRFKKTYVYFNQELLSDAVCGLLLGGKLNFGIGVKHGWRPLGKPRRVTKSYGNVVSEIDGAPAANIYEEYFASDIANLRKELKHISILYPIGIYLPGEVEYLLRNLLSIQDNGYLVFQGNVPQGAQIRLMIGTKESCLLATQQALAEVKKGLAGHKINFLLVFDSISRYILLGRQAEQELKIIKEALEPDTHIIGLYTYGEQAPLRAVSYQGMTYLHNQTITILGFGN